MKQIDKAEAKKLTGVEPKNFFIGLGVFSVLSGIVGLFSEDNISPNFHGRWGWFSKIIYDTFGPDGEYYVFILGGLWCFYYAIFKTKTLKK